MRGALAKVKTLFTLLKEKTRFGHTIENMTSPIISAGMTNLLLEVDSKTKKWLCHGAIQVKMVGTGGKHGIMDSVECRTAIIKMSLTTHDSSLIGDGNLTNVGISLKEAPPSMGKIIFGTQKIDS